MAAKTAVSFDVGLGRTQIPELVQESFVVANVGDRICSLAACTAEGSSADVVCAAGIAAATSSHIPCEESVGEGSIQIWTLHERGGGTFQFEVAHEGTKTDALEWCPCRECFAVPEGHGCSTDTRMGLLLAVCGNATVCVWAVPKVAETLQPPEPGQCALHQFCYRVSYSHLWVSTAVVKVFMLPHHHVHMDCFGACMWTVRS